MDLVVSVFLDHCHIVVEEAMVICSQTFPRLLQTQYATTDSKVQAAAAKKCKILGVVVGYYNERAEHQHTAPSRHTKEQREEDGVTVQFAGHFSDSLASKVFPLTNKRGNENRDVMRYMTVDRGSNCTFY